MCLARRERPLVVDSGQQISIADRYRLSRRPAARQSPKRSTSTSVFDGNPTRSRVVMVNSVPARSSTWRSDHSALRMLCRALLSITSGHSLAATSARECKPG